MLNINFDNIERPTVYQIRNHFYLSSQITLLEKPLILIYLSLK